MPRRFFIWCAIASLFLDQATKVLAYGSLQMHVPTPVLGHTLRFILTTNQRGLFGLSYGPVWIYLILPLLGMGLVVYFALHSPSRWLGAAYGIILGGAAGNLVDRVRLGSVIDFIDLGIGGWRWYTFNLSDVFIVVGVIMLLGHEVFGPRRPEKSVESDGGSPAPQSPVPGADAESLPRQ